MSKMEGFMIRLDADIHAKLKYISDSTNTKMVDIGRHAINALIEYSEQAGIDSVSFPLRYTKEIEDLKQKNTELQKIIQAITNTYTGAAAEHQTAYNVTDPSIEDAAQANAPHSSNGTDPP